jgi:GNAT superfamily N-acetyltransferase
VTTGTSVAIRPLQPGEVDEWLALRNPALPWPEDRERFVFSESLRPADEPVLLLGAWTPEGRLVGTAECYVGEDGLRLVDRGEAFVVVAPAYRRQRIGGRLADEIERFAAAASLRWLEAIFFERDLPAARPILEARGFGEMERYRTSIQQPATIDVSSLDSLRESLTRQGIKSVPFSEIDSADTRQQLYRCSMEIQHDMPHEPNVSWRDSPFQIWERRMFQAPGSSSDAIFVARDADQIVGLSYLVLRADGDGEVGDTGVVRTHRRRGIGRALKMMATRYAAQHGIPRVHTDNRTDNAGMLALNTQLGFMPGEAIVIFEKTLR